MDELQGQFVPAEERAQALSPQLTIEQATIWLQGMEELLKAKNYEFEQCDLWLNRNGALRGETKGIDGHIWGLKGGNFLGGMQYFRGKTAHETLTKMSEFIQDLPSCFNWTHEAIGQTLGIEAPVQQPEPQEPEHDADSEDSMPF